MIRNNVIQQVMKKMVAQVMMRMEVLVEIRKHQEEKMIVGEDEEDSSSGVKTKQVAMKRDAPSGS